MWFLSDPPPKEDKVRRRSKRTLFVWCLSDPLPKEDKGDAPTYPSGVIFTVVGFVATAAVVAVALKVAFVVRNRLRGESTYSHFFHVSYLNALVLSRLAAADRV